MPKIPLSESLKRIKKVREILKRHPSGITQREISNLTGIKPSSMGHIIYDFLGENVSAVRLGRRVAIRLISDDLSLKEERLATRELVLDEATKLREHGFSYSEIIFKLKKEFGVAIRFETLKHMKMSKEGQLRFMAKLSLDRRRAGTKGGKIHVTTGHIYRIKHLAEIAATKRAMERIPQSSRRLTKKKVRILAHCLFDGYIIDKAKRDHTVGYCNTSKILLDQFTNDVRDVYKLEPTDVRMRGSVKTIRYCSIAMVKDLERYLSFLGDWEVLSSRLLMKMSRGEYIEFLRAFWDDEGTVRFNCIKDKKGYIHTHRQVEAFQKNIGLLNQLREMHERLGIASYINKNKLIISDRINLLDFQKSVHFTNGVVSCRTTSNWYGTEKNKILRLAVESYGN